MEKVLGIGGFFFPAHDPKALAAWYEKYLGVAPVSTGHNQQPWHQEAGATAFAPFAQSTDYWGDPTSPHPQQWMINFRVKNLDAMIGRFARLHDPEGNPIELWQPA